LTYFLKEVDILRSAPGKIASGGRSLLEPWEIQRTPPLKNRSELCLSGPTLIDLIKEVINKTLPFRLKVTGFSMFPFIRNGDVITISPLPFSPPKIGDILAFTVSHGRKLFIHRVIGKKGNSYLTRGDNTLSVDGLIPRADILGMVIRAERNGKRVYCGLGPERFLIALLVRTTLFPPFLQFMARLPRPLKRFFFSSKDNSGDSSNMAHPNGFHRERGLENSLNIPRSRDPIQSALKN
jgi:hypothetical protein